MTVLITGGTGKTGHPLAAELREHGSDIRVASRTPGREGAFFDWADPGSHRPVVRGVERLYLVPPLLSVDPMPMVRPFLDAAHAEGVRRVVVLSSSAVLADAPGLAELRFVAREFPEWAVLRPSGFMQNFVGAHPVAAGIREHGEIRTAAGDGRLGWVDAADIAAVAARLLLAPEIASGERFVTGPETLSYPQAASIIGDATGKPVHHRDVSAEDLARSYRETGMPDPFASALAGFDRDISQGAEDHVSPEVERLTGRPARSFRDFVRANRDGFG
ncbi:uncharacterized protein YbjT (DUF2867 family) [Haloactinospora alba]|uniref:Uncharacterized protein YbjT (DUF2867 family) n=1 Tax=Haloactinospora alba TaxID=405555 RepID=A0A543NEF2_9ACTN|nr:ergot alkaloid biosynthesis protein [Haloactinospora alba]TQN30195.1 uncharacterized protein YbjT (DUF2867 family) [Haloactinospora alba]